MKTIITSLLFLFLFTESQVFAQEPGDSKPLASTTSAKGWRELRKEKKVKRRESKLLKKNERVARSQEKDKHYRKFSLRRRKKSKEKNHIVF